jgi:D-threo-aldose 1-dehydrogenase
MAFENRRIGTTSLMVSTLGLGAAPLGGLFSRSSDTDAIETVRASVAAGINYIDVAPHYGQGLAEKRLGLAVSGISRSSFTLSTKVGRLLEETEATPTSQGNWPEALNFATVYDTSRRGIVRSLDDSLARMGVAEVDILLLHDPDRYAQDAASLRSMIAEAYETLSMLRDEGRVKAIGIGVNSPDPCLMAMEHGKWDCFVLAGSYSVLRQEDKNLLDRCVEASISVLIGGPYMSGALAGGSTWRYRPIPEEIERDLERLKTVCSEFDVPMQAAALQFPLQHPAVSSVIVGMRSAHEVAENVEFLSRSISADFWSTLADEGLIAPR